MLTKMSQSHKGEKGSSLLLADEKVNSRLDPF